MQYCIQLIIFSENERIINIFRSYLNNHRIINNVYVSNGKNISIELINNFDIIIIDNNNLINNKIENRIKDIIFLDCFENKQGTLEKETIEKLNFLLCQKANNNLILNLIKILHKMGIPSHLNGYKYLHCILSHECCRENIYRAVEDEYKISKKIIERSIRYAINVGWRRSNFQDIDNIFGNSLDIEKSKPTNTEFIMAILEVINNKDYYLSL